MTTATLWTRDRAFPEAHPSSHLGSQQSHRLQRAQQQPASRCCTTQQPVCGWGTCSDRTLPSTTSRLASTTASFRSERRRNTGELAALTHSLYTLNPHHDATLNATATTTAATCGDYPGAKRTRAAKADAVMQPQPMQRSRGNRCRSPSTTQTLSQYMQKHQHHTQTDKGKPY